ncbi:MAG: heavy metal-associated domain-containing protein [Planctomycetota bacterium]|jgi:copper chaperone CopZ|nr:heavy metal-associated domain-containing protein [Planctomycetota bacterium]MDA1026645.1 heavy metal-associated domain-containing protein [Planctomycetota bacterium]
MTFFTIARPRSDHHTFASLVSIFLMIVMIAMVFLSQFTLGGCREARESDASAAANRPPAQTFVIEVSGMHCGSCAEAITAKVAKIDGVTTCEADWQRGTTTVLARPDTIPTIQDSIARMGFTIEQDATLAPTEDQKSVRDSKSGAAAASEDASPN